MQLRVIGKGLVKLYSSWQNQAYAGHVDSALF